MAVQTQKPDCTVPDSHLSPFVTALSITLKYIFHFFTFLCRHADNVPPPLPIFPMISNTLPVGTVLFFYFRAAALKHCAGGIIYLK